MLYFDLNRVFAMRGIKFPYKYLVSHGFTPSTAVRLTNQRVDNLNMAFVERLCRILNCTPNDLLGWKPSKDESVSDKNPLKSLQRNEDLTGLSRKIKSLPMDELEKFLKSFSQDNGNNESSGK